MVTSSRETYFVEKNLSLGQEIRGSPITGGNNSRYEPGKCVLPCQTHFWPGSWDYLWAARLGRPTFSNPPSSPPTVSIIVIAEFVHKVECRYNMFHSSDILMAPPGFTRLVTFGTNLIISCDYPSILLVDKNCIVKYFIPLDCRGDL